RRNAGHRVRLPCAPLVPDHHAGEGGQTFEEMPEVRHLPVELDVGDKAGNEDEVERALAKYLVGDAHAPALGVPGLRLHRSPLSRRPAVPGESYHLIAQGPPATRSAPSNPTEPRALAGDPRRARPS